MQHNKMKQEIYILVLIELTLCTTVSIHFYLIQNEKRTFVYLATCQYEFRRKKTVKGISNINYYGVKLRQERNWHMVDTQIEL